MDRARARVARFARLLAVTAAALGLALTVGAAAPKEALAAPATISGQAYIHCTNPGQTNGDGNVFDVTISYSGHSFSGYTGYCQDHGLPYPADGWYPFTGTWTGSGYDILIDSRGATPHPECVFTSGPCQRVGGLDTLFNPLGDMDLLKKSSNPAVSDGNACYSLAGAVYSVYGSQADAQSGSNRLATLVTNADGYAKATGLQMGAYYVKETTPAKGYALDGTVYPVQVEPAECAHVNGGTVYDVPQDDPAIMWVGKIDLDTTLNMPQGSASLAGAQYTVKYYAGYYDNVADLPSSATRTWVVETNEDGAAVLDPAYRVSGDDFYFNTLGDVTIPLGTVSIQETKAPQGYLLGNQPIYLNKITSNGYVPKVETYNAPKDPEQVIKGGVKISKVDAETGDTPQGDASLAGIRFAIVNESANPVAVEGGTYADGQVVKVIETDASGTAATAADSLPYGSYSVHEVVSGTAGDGTALANGGYLLGGEAVTIDGVKMSSEKKAFDIKENGKVVDLSADQFANQVGRAGVSFHKLDRETNQPYPLGAGDLAAKFQIENASAHAVKVAGTVYQPGETVYAGKATATASGWKLETSKDLLPCGSYKLVETDPGEGYERSTQEVAFTIDADDFGLVKDLSTLSDPAGAMFANQVVRADVKLQKRDDTTGNKMAGVPFLIESVATGEKHVAVTDKNGAIDTSATRANSNAFDAALKDDGTIDDDKLVELVKRYGDNNSAEKQPTVWFGMNEKGTTAPASAALGALPYDTYKVTELPCKANEGRQMIETEFTVARSDNHAVIDLGTMDDVEASIRTNAWDGATNSITDKDIIADDEAVIVDRVSYEDFIPGRTYMVRAEAHDADTGAILTDASGNEVTGNAEFTPDKKNGSVDVRLAFDASQLADSQKVAVYEFVSLNGQEIAKHADKNDAEQTVAFHKPAIATTAKASDGTKVVKLDPEAKITDTVACRNLREGADYVLSLELVKAADGAPVLDAQGNPVTASKDFKADSANMSVDVDATFDASQLADGDNLVCFETLTKKATGKVAAEHKDLTDAGQTLATAKPRISTTMTDAAGLGHSAAVDDQMKLTDKVEHWGLIADGRSYELDAHLMVVSADEEGEASAEPYVDADGNEVKAVKEFKPDTAHGFVDVELSFNGLNLTDGQKLVCFETLKRAGSELAEHADASDEGQTVKVALPKIGTTLTDAAGGDKNIVSNNPVKLTDTVSYMGLVPGREYVVSGALMQKDADGNAVAVMDAAGEAVTAKTTFTPEKANGTVEVTFEFDGSELAHGNELVAFESLTRSGVELAVHADIEDAAQTVKVANPLIGTLAHDGLDGDSTVVADADASIVDDVTYKNLAKGSKYTLVAMAMDKETRLPLYTGGEANGTVTDTVSGQIESFYSDVLKAMGTDKDSLDAYAKAMAGHKDGEALPVLKVGTVDYEALQKALANRTKLASQLVMKQADFAAEAADGIESVTLDFDASKWLKADTPADCVVYEFLIHDGKLVAAHADIDDGGQTFAIAPSTIRTTLTDETDGDHVILPSTTTSLIDTVAYENLIPGKEYKVSGKLMLKDTGKPLYVGDKAVTAEKTFTPNQPSGTVELRFEFDSSSLDGKEIVAFEKLTKDDVEVAVHEDIDDQNQTVTVDKLNGAKGKTYSKTGVSLFNYAWLGWMLLIAAIGTFCAGEAAHRREMKHAAACAKDAE